MTAAKFREAPPICSLQLRTYHARTLTPVPTCTLYLERDCRLPLLKQLAMASISFEVWSSIRGYHIYKTVWTPYIGETLSSPPAPPASSSCYVVLCPDPTLCKEKGLAHFEPFLVFADSTVQDPGLPIRLQACDFSCDKAIILCNTTQYGTIHYHTCYDKYLVWCGIDDWTMM